MGDETQASFNFKAKTFDFTFSNTNSSDQIVRMKEAFQLYLRKDEVNFFELHLFFMIKF
jgi:hypothetical protein